MLARAAEGQYPRGVVLKLIALGVVQNLAVIVPIGLALAIVLALGRLYHDSEMSAAQACGAGNRPIFLPVIAFTVILSILLGVLSLGLAPQTNGMMLALRSEALRAGQFAPITAGKFRMFGGGSTVVYAQGAEKDGTLTRVFVERDRGDHLEIALAQRATHAYAENGNLQVITLFDGERYEGVPGERKFRIVKFAENSIPVRLPEIEGTVSSLDGVPTRQLLAGHDPEKLAEFHFRLAFPVMTIVLGFICVPLAHLRPRQGRYARVGFVVLVFFVYIQLTIAGRMWVARGIIPAWLGLWWVHLAVIALASTMLLVPPWLARLRYRRNETRRLAAAVPA